MSEIGRKLRVEHLLEGSVRYIRQVGAVAAAPFRRSSVGL
jgi:hypothetical protein